MFICALWVSLNGFSQNKAGLKNSAGEIVVKYIGSSEVRGNSVAVIVNEVPLAHTKQFLPLDKNGNVSGKGNLSKQVDQLFLNISQALKQADGGIDKIIKLNVFLKSIDMMSEVQPLIGQKFHPARKPSISFVAGDLAHPDALLSMDAIALSGLNAHEVQLLGSSASKGQADVAVLPIGPVVYVSGQAAKGGLAEAARGTLKQLDETLTSLGLNKNNIVQIKSFLSPMSSLSIVEKEFSQFFKGETIPPLVYVDWISSDPVIEIELIAASPVSSAKTAGQIEYITPPGMRSSPVYSKVVKLNYGKKLYMSGIYSQRSQNNDEELNSIFTSMKDLLTATKSDFMHLLKATYYITNDQYSKSLSDLRPRYYDPLRPPAASKAMVKGIGMNGAGISIDMIGTIRE